MLDQLIPLLEEKGWCKFLLIEPNGGMCILGGLNYLTSGGDALWPFNPPQEYEDAIKALSTAAYDMFNSRVAIGDIPGGRNSLASVNNHPDTTFNDMKLVISKAQELQAV